MDISRDIIVAGMPECAHVIDKYIDPLNEAFVRFEINTPERVAAFLAQCGHESTRLTRVEENLNYSANGLMRTFPTYFTPETSKEFAYKPQMIANRVYANKGGNGNEESGDGWKFRGRGLVQVTLYNNYLRRGRRLVNDSQYFVVDPDKMLEPEWAVRSSCDYWDENELNIYADRNTEEDFRSLTRKINRGLRGLDDRFDLWWKYKVLLGLPGKSTE
jgi:putative chitinase